MGYLGRRIGVSQSKAAPSSSDGAGGTGGGILDLFASGYFQREGSIYNAPGVILRGLTATGGVISDYASGSDVYRAHIFTSTGPFNVSELSTDFPNDVDYLVVAGGGGGGENDTNRGGGGGAGGLRSNFPTIPAPFKTPTFTASVQDYAITVGAGGAGASISGTGYINPGSNSSIGTAVVASGGGGGGNRLSDPAPGTYPSSPEMAGGSGGGGGSGPGGGTGGPTVNSPDPLTPQAQGNAGGAGEGGGPTYGAGGGGGAGAAGSDGTTSAGGDGGNGLQVLIAGPPASDQPVGTPGTNPGGGYFAGGGGGGVYSGTSVGSGGEGGGGAGGQNPGQTTSTAGTQSTGGGGGGNYGKSGGSGIVVIRYKIASVSAAKETGGSVSFYGGKTIHTFTGNGTFTTTSDWNAGTDEVEYVCVGGGGGGGGADQNCWGAGGGGAGQMRTGTTTISHPSPVAITIGAGGIGNVRYDDYTATNGSNTTVAFPAGTITGYGGGYGGSNDPSTQTSGNDGTNHPNVPAGSGSGGGASKNTPSTAGDGGPSALGAYPGGSMPGGNHYVGAGGGGAGGAGGRGSDAPGNRDAAEILGDGLGGVGLQVPTTFRNPAVTFDGVHSDAQHYLAGGGGGGMFNPSPQVNPDKGGKGGGGAGGGGAPGIPGSRGGNGLSNTGGGGGGSGSFNDTTLFMGGNGGSGIVIIAYPT